VNAKNHEGVDGMKNNLTLTLGVACDFKLLPGMQVIAEVRLGERTVLEYLLSPVQKAIKEAGRER
jgi:hypothetical protein